MLQEFVTANRDELIRRCRSKMGQRNFPPVSSFELKYGVPLFLEQLVEALRCEQAESAAGDALTSAPWRKTGVAVESSRTAALHGEELATKGYSVDQVVHGYGDICQSVTELATEMRAPITVEEFHTFNRLLDDAIADAVSSHVRHHDRSADLPWYQDLLQRMDTLADEQRGLLDTALKALEAAQRRQHRNDGAAESRPELMNSASELDRLPALIRRERDALLYRWREQVRELPSAQHLDVPTLNDHVPQLIDALAAALKARSGDTIPEALSEASPPAHGLQGVQDGFDIVEVVAEYNILRGCIHDLAQANGLTLQGEPLHILNRVLDGAIALAVLLEGARLRDLIDRSLPTKP